ncbi:MAG: MBL fold metallo-hydrolase, partial [Melioribacteraceae bacterium]|nr:MBL fold metallo-hydrolase [Melioribacteraceae bacterium]
EDKICELIVPEGGLLYIPNYDFNANDLKWWNTTEINGVKITSAPVLHNGMRYGLDYDWLPRAFTSYIIEYNGITVYFGGDTGYDSTTTIFKETAKRFPEIDLAILPIAPIHPREYSYIRHTDPHDALLVSKELKAKRMIPMHYDTFAEAYDTLGEAEQLMKKEM